jgi:hypothetical protein
MILSMVRLAISARDRVEVLRTLRIFMGHTTARAGCTFWSTADNGTHLEPIRRDHRWN